MIFPITEALLNVIFTLKSLFNSQEQLLFFSIFLEVGEIK